MKAEDPRCGECIHFSYPEWERAGDVVQGDWYECKRRNNRAVHPQTYWCEESHFESRVSARSRYKELWSSTVALYSAQGIRVDEAVRHGDEVVRRLVEFDDWEKKVDKPKWSVTAEVK